MKMLIAALVLVTSSIVAGQRGSFAGTRPIGFPDTPNRTTTTQDPLGNRFGEGTTERLPIEANGDRDYIDRLSKLPLDKQPFWFINWQSYEKHRKDPQTYPQRPNAFVDPIPNNNNNANFGQANNGFSAPTSGFIGTQSTGIFNRFGPTTAPSQPSNNVGPTGNINNNAYPSSIVYPNVNPISNVYPTGYPNSNVYPTYNVNSNSDSGAITKNGAGFQTAQKYPEYYPRTDTYPQRSGHAFF